MTPDDFRWASHRVRRDVLNAVVFAVIFAGYCGVMALPGGPAAVLAAGTAAAAVYSGWGARKIYRQARGLAVTALSTSFHLIALGRLNEAWALLRAIEEKPRFAWVARLVDIQLAVIAIRRGNMEIAEKHLDAAIARPLGRTARESSRQQIEGAHALRAFVRAAFGRRAALEDIATVRGSGIASPDALARVSLAEAMILDRSGERDELKALLDRDRELLIEHTHPRERAIVRAYQRMLRAATGSVYRQKAPREPEIPGAEEPRLADWVARIAPGAAPFVRSPRGAESAATESALAALAAPAATERGKHAVEAARAAARPKRSRMALIGLAGTVLVLATTAIALAMTAKSAVIAAYDPRRSVDPKWLLLALPVLIPALFHLVGYVATRRAGGAEAQRRDPSDVALAQDCLMRAGVAERRGDFAEAIDHAGRGLGRLADERSRSAADMLYPDLISLRAFALAACDRHEEAEAELVSLGAGYPHKARAAFRVRLVQLLRARDLAGAAAWVEQSEADLPLSVREELLADLARAAAAPDQAGAGEASRLRDELRAPEIRRWVDIAAPGLIEAFEGRDADEELAQAELEASEALHRAPLTASAAPQLATRAAMRRA
jgi:hypothetical protein